MSSWLSETAQALKKGYIVTIDYGREAVELYSQQRSRGTLTTFYRHTQTDNPYVRIGQQDMTAQVDFTTLKRLGENFGMTNLGYLTQARFLSNLGLRRWIARLSALGLSQPHRDANRMGMLQLIRPNGMGDFKVLIQGKGVRDVPLWGLQPSAELENLVQCINPPLLTDRHMPLLQGRYPSYGIDTMEFDPR
jgi:SAM-dependent MidA family methyltransferase